MAHEHSRLWGHLRGLAALALAVGAATASVAAADNGPGYVDAGTFIDIAGDDALEIQVSIRGALLNTITRANADLRELAGGLKSIEAVILDLDRRGAPERAREAVRQTERRLMSKGWERPVLVRDGDGEVRVLVLSDGENIQGLVVMIIDMDEGQMVFANIAGRVNLAAIGEIGDAMGLPGLDDLDLDD